MTTAQVAQVYQIFFVKNDTLKTWNKVPFISFEMLLFDSEAINFSIRSNGQHHFEFGQLSLIRHRC